MNTYPINLVLDGRLVLLVGGKGEIAHKAPGLLEVGARVRVIAPTVDESLAQLAQQGDIEWWPRRYQPGDLTSATVVFAATRDADVHAQIWAEGRANNQLVNVMDVVDKCNFHGVSMLRRGQLTIAIGTGGAAPALAVTLRRRFENEVGEEYATFLDIAQGLRPLVAQRIPSFRQRQLFWYELVESDVLALLREGREVEMRALTATLIEHYAARAANLSPRKESQHEPQSDAVVGTATQPA